jgi:hypothetical protein
MRLRTLSAPLVLISVLATSGVRFSHATLDGIGQEPHFGPVLRLPGNPLLYTADIANIGKVTKNGNVVPGETNINGPSVIRVPDWLQKPLGKYYLYFANHNGKSIRLAYSDKAEGPYKFYAPGTLQLADSHFTDHIASPDVIVDNAAKQIRIYYHGLTPGEGGQHTRIALSSDGLHFKAVAEPAMRNSAYWRLFHYGDWWYALAMPGKLLRSKDGLTGWEAGPQLFPASPTQVHNAVMVKGNVLHVFYTRAGDAPERILYSRVKLDGDWAQWKPSLPRECLRPTEKWEGAELPVEPGKIGALEKPVHALRDPALLVDGDKTYLFYAIAGESGIAVAEIDKAAWTHP